MLFPRYGSYEGQIGEVKSQIIEIWKFPVFEHCSLISFLMMLYNNSQELSSFVHIFFLESFVA